MGILMMFKVIIAGGRDFEATIEDMNKIDHLLGRYKAPHGEVPMFNNLEMVTGTAKGADQVPYYYNYWQGVPIKEFPADWDKHGKAAGFIRNRQMAEYSDALIAFWDGKSRGTKNMIEEMNRLEKPVRVISYWSQEEEV